MTAALPFLKYTGCVDYKVTDHLLKGIKKNRDFRELNKTIAKRIYAIIVECLENIARHAEKCSPEDPLDLPYISVTRENDVISIRAGNLIPRDKISKLEAGITLINSLNETELLNLFDSKINTHHLPGQNGAGLGFMLMKLKSRHNIDMKFTLRNNDLALFELKITINNYIMRKLIMNQTSNSPKVVLDPDENRYEISGESRPPDVATFYGDIISWFDDYSHYLLKSPETREPVVVNLDFEYFNSSSAKYILDFCKKIADVRSKGKEVSVSWHYEDDDLDMLETGREMSKMAKFPFEYVLKDKK